MEKLAKCSAHGLRMREFPASASELVGVMLDSSIAVCSRSSYRSSPWFVPAPPPPVVLPCCSISSIRLRCVISTPIPPTYILRQRPEGELEVPPIGSPPPGTGLSFTTSEGPPVRAPPDRFWRNSRQPPPADLKIRLSTPVFKPHAKHSR